MLTAVDTLTFAARRAFEHQRLRRRSHALLAETSNFAATLRSTTRERWRRVRSSLAHLSRRVFDEAAERETLNAHRCGRVWRLAVGVDSQFFLRVLYNACRRSSDLAIAFRLHDELDRAKVEDELSRLASAMSAFYALIITVSKRARLQTLASKKKNMSYFCRKNAASILSKNAPLSLAKNTPHFLRSNACQTLAMYVAEAFDRMPQQKKQLDCRFNNSTPSI